MNNASFRLAGAERYASRYQFACEMTSEFAFLVDAPNNPLQRERVEFPYGGDILRSVAYCEDPSKPFSASTGLLIEILTDVTRILVKKDPFPHLTIVGQFAPG